MPGPPHQKGPFVLKNQKQRSNKMILTGKSPSENDTGTPNMSSKNLDKLDHIDSAAMQLTEVIELEKTLLLQLLTKLNGCLAGKWPKDFSEREEEYFRERPDKRPKIFTAFQLKIKVASFHFLMKREIDFLNGEKKVFLIAKLFKVEFISRRRKQNHYETHKVAESWNNIRNHITLSELVDAISSELASRLKAAKKQDLSSIEKRIENM